jgi:hypothetical protein
MEAANCPVLAKKKNDRAGVGVHSRNPQKHNRTFLCALWGLKAGLLSLKDSSFPQHALPAPACRGSAVESVVKGLFNRSRKPVRLAAAWVKKIGFWF